MKTRYIIAYIDKSHISHSIASCSRCQRELCRSGCNILLEKLEWIVLAELNYIGTTLADCPEGLA